MQRSLATEALHVNVGVFLEQKVDHGFAGAVLQATGNHKWGPAGAVLDVRIEEFRIYEQSDDWKVIVGACPVDGEARVIVDELSELWVRLPQEG